MRFSLLLVPLSIVTASTGVAKADERMPSATSCPEGAEPASVHGAAECYPTSCADDSGCKTGYVCVERALCVEGRLGSMGPTSRVAVGSCGAGDSCKYPATCETARRCVKEASGSKLKRACGCTAVGAPDGAAGLALVAAAVVAGAFGRRRR